MYVKCVVCPCVDVVGMCVCVCDCECVCSECVCVLCVCVCVCVFTQNQMLNTEVSFNFYLVFWGCFFALFIRTFLC